MTRSFTSFALTPSKKSRSSSLLACALFLSLGLPSCGGSKDAAVGESSVPPSRQSDEWPARATAPPDAASVKTVLDSADSVPVKMRGYLVAINVPCPVCNTELGSPRSGKAHDTGIGRSRKTETPAGPGCVPCPTPAATFSDDPPKKAASPDSAPIRAVGAALGLQPRHIGHVFLLTGTLHTNGAAGPEIDVSDVQILDP
jgi:hypothetical protein